MRAQRMKAGSVETDRKGEAGSVETDGKGMRGMQGIEKLGGVGK